MFYCISKITQEYAEKGDKSQPGGMTLVNYKSLPLNPRLNNPVGQASPTGRDFAKKLRPPPKSTLRWRGTCEEAFLLWECHSSIFLFLVFPPWALEFCLSCFPLGLWDFVFGAFPLGLWNFIFGAFVLSFGILFPTLPQKQ